MRSLLFEWDPRYRADGGGEMGDQDRLQDLEVLAALLADIERELEAAGEDEKGKLREMQQHCLLRLALLKKPGHMDVE